MRQLRSSFGIIVGLSITILIIFYLSDFFSVHPITSKIEYEIYTTDEELNESKLKADDPKVINALLKRFLFPPSNKPYNLSSPEIQNPSMGQAQLVDQILNKKRDGFYIECGALDGESRSNTIFFERERNWRGLLIEADPKNFAALLNKRRKAHSSPTCLAPSAHPMPVKFQQRQNMGHIIGMFFHDSGGPRPEEIVDIQCFPLVSYLKAIHIHTVDYFSLDVEGAEFDVLKSLPWKDLDIKVLSVEFAHNKHNKSSIREFMEGNGYIMHSEVTRSDWMANDFIFVHKDLAINAPKMIS